MKLFLLGATGRTGKLVLQAALERGLSVNCLVRNSQQLAQHDNLKIYQGLPTDAESLSKAMEGCTHVISTLNVSRTTDFPWSKLKAPKTLMSDTMTALIPLAEKQGTERITVCSAWGVKETKKDIPGWFRWFIDNSNVGTAYQDHERQEDALENTGLAWTIVRPVGLTNSSKIQPIKETFASSHKPNMTISRKSVASYLLESLTRDDLVCKKVVISKG